jgi:hypothetical protein
LREAVAKALQPQLARCRDPGRPSGEKDETPCRACKKQIKGHEIIFQAVAGRSAECLRRPAVNLLLDTCTFLWIVSGSSRLSKQAVELFSDPANDVVLSSVSYRLQSNSFPLNGKHMASPHCPW